MKTAAILLLGLLSACVPDQAMRPAAPDALRRADAALAEGRLDDAEQDYARVLAADETNAAARIGVAEIALAQGDVARARDLFTDAASSPGAAPTARQGLGLALLRQGRADAAAAELQAAVAADPALWRSWNGLGVFHDGRRDWAAAEAAYDRASGGVGRSAAVANNKGFSMLRQGRFAEAEALFTDALRLQPDSRTAENNRRMALAMQGRYAEARAGAAADRLADVLNDIAVAATARNDLATARALLVEAMEASPSYHQTAAGNLARLDGR